MYVYICVCVCVTLSHEHEAGDVNAGAEVLDYSLNIHVLTPLLPYQTYIYLCIYIYR